MPGADRPGATVAQPVRFPCTAGPSSTSGRKRPVALPTCICLMAEQPRLTIFFKRRYCGCMDRSPVSLVEFPADDPERALRFWQGVLNIEFDARKGGEGEGWQTRSDATEIGVHKRGTGPGDTFSLPYLIVDDMADTLHRVIELDGTVIHPGDDFAICKDSEGSPFGLMAKPR